LRELLRPPWYHLALSLFLLTFLLLLQVLFLFVAIALVLLVALDWRMSGGVNEDGH
jgi:hypothetical protein